MSDMLIKNIKMPTACYGCELLMVIPNCPVRGEMFLSGYLVLKRHDGCPLVEVKPHGDLIDRDEAMAEFADRMCVDDILDGVYEPAVEVLRSAPTILEATNE